MVYVCGRPTYVKSLGLPPKLDNMLGYTLWLHCTPWFHSKFQNTSELSRFEYEI